jgi:hypothetical protein
MLHTSRSPLLDKTANDIEEWPFRSPDLIPQDFFWEFLKGNARITSLLLTEETKTRTIATNAKNDKIFSKICCRKLNIGLMLLMSVAALTLAL